MCEQETNSQPQASRRSWRSRLLTYSLRGLLVLVLLICVVLAAYVWLLQDYYEQQAIQRELQQRVVCRVSWSWYSADFPDVHKRSPSQLWLMDLVGEDPWGRIDSIDCKPESEVQVQAVVDAVARLGTVESLNISRDYRGFQAMPGIKTLVLSHGVRDEDLFREVDRMTSLRTLRVAIRDVQDEDINQLTNLTNLRALSVILAEGVTSDSLTTIAGMNALEELNLCFTNVDERNLELLQALPLLQTLDLHRTKVTDAAIPKLAELPSLKDLDLSHNSLSAAAVSRLSQSPHLERLVLDFTSVTDDDVSHLSQMKQLKVLRLEGNAMSVEGLERLRQALPETEIEHPLLTEAATSK